MITEIPSNIGAVQALTIRCGVHLDQDGNRYSDAKTKYLFLRDCLTQGVRSGNLQPITTANQCRDLIDRLNASALACSEPVLSEGEITSELAHYAAEENQHERRLAIFRKMERSYIGRGSHAWRLIYAMTAEEIETKLAYYETQTKT